MKNKFQPPVGSLKKRTKDERDFHVGAVIKWPKLSEIADVFHIKNLSVKNQIADGNEDFCGSCAGTAVKEPQEGIELFYPFLFAAAKHESGDDPDSWGLELRDVGKAICKWGIPALSDVPEEIRNLGPKERRRIENYPKSVIEAAAKHKGQSYFFLNGPYDHFDNARGMMQFFASQGFEYGVVLGVEFGWPLSEYKLVGFPDGYGHAMAGLGWNSRDGLDVLNSAGASAGKKGHHDLTRATFNKYAEQFGCLVVTDMPREMAEFKVKSVDVGIFRKVALAFSYWIKTILA